MPEKKFACSSVILSSPSSTRSVPPAAKKTMGMMIAAATIMATSWAKSVSTEARKPDHSV